MVYWFIAASTKLDIHRVNFLIKSDLKYKTFDRHCYDHLPNTVCIQ